MMLYIGVDLGGRRIIKKVLDDTGDIKKSV